VRIPYAELPWVLGINPGFTHAFNSKNFFFYGNTKLDGHMVQFAANNRNAPLDFTGALYFNQPVPLRRGFEYTTVFYADMAAVGGFAMVMQRSSRASRKPMGPYVPCLIFLRLAICLALDLA
jgi:hypothetical protein